MIKLIKSTFLNEQETKARLCEFINKTPTLSMGAECKRFERRFAEKQERQYAVLVNSGSSANLVLIQALLNLGRLKKGDRVGVSVLTWSTNIMPLIQLGLVPVAIDCELGTLNVSSETLKPHLHQLEALFLTNVLGFSSDLGEIKKLCTAHSILLLEDNCESLGSRTENTLLGNFGAASTFSFFVGHHLSTVEGGMVCTDDEALANALVLARAHGWDRELPAEHQRMIREKHDIDPFYAKYTFYELGYNVRPTEITGFVGNLQLEAWDALVSRRAENFAKLQRAIVSNEDLIPLDVSHMELVSNFAMPLIAKTRELFERYRTKFEKANIEIRPVIAGDITQQPFYRKYVQIIREAPNARLVHSQGFYFPNNPELSEEELEILIRLLK